MIPLRDAEPVKYILAVTYNQEEILRQSLTSFEAKFGKIDNISQSFKFDHTDYYNAEMGPYLMKQFFSFEKSFNKDDLIN